MVLLISQQRLFFQAKGKKKIYGQWLVGSNAHMWIQPKMTTLCGAQRELHNLDFPSGTSFTDLKILPHIPPLSYHPLFPNWGS